MSVGSATDLMTAEEFFEWANRPENEAGRFELDRGRVVEMSRPNGPHGLVVWAIIHVLTTYIIARRRGLLYPNDTGLLVARHPDTLRGPDVMVYAEPDPAEHGQPSFLRAIPSLVVEVLSPSDLFSEVDRKVRQYQRRGIPLIWLVDPDDKVVHVHRLNELPRRLDEGDEIDGNGVLPEFKCQVADFFKLPGQ